MDESLIEVVVKQWLDENIERVLNEYFTKRIQEQNFKEFQRFGEPTPYFGD